MDPTLFGVYIISILLMIAAILILFLVWKDYFPQKWFVFLIISFTCTTLGLIILLIAEINAPHSDNFYLNPILYSLYLFLVGCSLFSSYLLIHEIYFQNHKRLFYIGFITLGWIILGTILTIIAFSITTPSTYPLVFYFMALGVFGLGIVAYFLLSIGSFRDSRSDRLEAEHRRGLKLVAIFGFGIAYGLSIIAMGVLVADYSITIDPDIAAFWLLWFDLVIIIFLYTVHKAVKYIT